MVLKVVKEELIKGTSFTKTEAAELTRLLGLVEKDSGRWPTQECFIASDRAVSRPSPEIVITDPPWQMWEDATQLLAPPRVLLVMYGTEGGGGGFDPHWTLAGGRTELEEDVEDAVRRVGQKKLEANVEWTRAILGKHKWKKGEHPDGGRPLSLYVKCYAPNGVTETSNRKFFPVNALPKCDGKGSPHCANLEAYFHKLLAGRCPW